MVVDLISKVSLDEGSTPSISTLLCRQWPLTRRVSAVFSGMTGFDSLQVWVKEIMAAYKWQINQHVSAAFKEGSVDRSPGCDIPGFLLRLTVAIWQVADYGLQPIKLHYRYSEAERYNNHEYSHLLYCVLVPVIYTNSKLHIF